MGSRKLQPVGTHPGFPATPPPGLLPLSPLSTRVSPHPSPYLTPKLSLFLSRPSVSIPPSPSPPQPRVGLKSNSSVPFGNLNVLHVFGS